MPSAIPPPVDKQTIASVVARATAWRRERYRDDAQYAHFTDGAMAEQVCGVEGTPYDRGDGWWLVGCVADVIANVELAVLVNPSERRIRVRAPAPPPEQTPTKAVVPMPHQEGLPESERRFRAWLEAMRTADSIRRGRRT